MLPQAARDDSGKTFMAVRQVDNENFVVLQRGCFDQFDCFCLTLAGQLLAASFRSFKSPQVLPPPHAFWRRAASANVPPCRAVPMR